MTFHLTSAQRSAAAKKSAATRKREGIKVGWAALSSAKRHAAAVKSMATKKAKGEKIGFARLSSSQRSTMARKAAATRKARGELSYFSKETAAQRHANALKAAATRRAEGIKPFSHETAAQRSAAAKKAAATRAANKGTSAKTSSTSTTTSSSTASHGHTINPRRHRAGRLTPATRKHLGHIRRHHRVNYHQHLVRHRVTSRHTTSLGGTTGKLGRALNPYDISRKQPVQLRLSTKAHTPIRPRTHAVVSRNPRHLRLAKA